MDRNRDLWWGLGLLNGACYLAALVGFGTYEGALAYYTRPPEAVARTYLTYGLRRLNQGQAGEARPRFDYALRYVNQAIEHQERPADATDRDTLPDLYLLRSLILYHQGQDQQSQDDIARALNRNPRLGSAYRLLGLLYARQERYQDALAALNRAIDLEPASGEAYYGRGMIHLRLDQRQDAVRDWQRAEKLLAPRAAIDPDMAQTLNHLRQQINRYRPTP